MQPPQVRHGPVHTGEMGALAVDEGLLPEDDVAIAVVRHLVPLEEDAAHQALVVHRAAALVLVDVRVVVVPDPAPVGLTGAARRVGVVLAGVPDHVEGPVRAELRQRVQQDVREGAAPELVRRGRQVHRTVIEGHRHQALLRTDALDAARIAQMMGRLGQEPLEEALALLARFHDQ